MKTQVTHLAILIALSIPALADTPYINTESIGTTHSRENVSDTAIPTIAIKNLQGLKVLILPKIKSMQKFGYFNIHAKGKRDYSRTSYSEIAGKTALISDVVTGDSSNYPQLHLKFDDGKEYFAETMVGAFPDIALVSDIDESRKYWLNKTLWYKGTEIKTFDASKDVEKPADGETPISKFSIKRIQPLTITNIVASWDSDFPVRFVVKTKDGDEGFLDLHVSNTNVHPLLWSLHNFENTFLETDPRAINSWDAATWEAIENSKAVIGMTPEQVELSWGKPRSINEDILGDGPREQWVYVDQYVYIQKGHVTAISTTGADAK